MKIKKIIAFIAICILLTGTVGCTEKSSKTDQQDKIESKSVENDVVINEVKDAANEQENNVNEDVKKEELPAKELPQYDLKLEITNEQKEAFIEEYGNENFEIAYGWAQGCFQMYRSDLDQAFLEELQKDYDVEQLKIVSSYDGHHIPADYVLANGSKDADTVIILHGYTGTRRMMPELEVDLLKKGYNVFAIDTAGAGENECELATYGAYEQYEVLDCIKHVKKEMSSDKKVIIWGCSYGGGVIGVCLGNKKINDLVDAAILDCPVGDFRQNIIAQVEGYKALKDEALVAGYDDTFYYLDKYAQMMYGFSLDDVSAAKCAKQTTLPVLIFTSKADDNVPMKQPVAIYNAVPHDKKYIKIFEDVPHVCGWSMEETREEYQQIIEDFLAGKLYE